MLNKLCIILLLHVFFWVALKPVQPTTDDLVYLYHAKILNAGEYKLTDSPKNHRFTVFAPTALFIKVFGESPFTISLWPLICSLMTILVLFRFLSKQITPLLALLACLLLACNVLQIMYSVALFPDVIVAFFAMLCVMEIYKGQSAFRLKHALLAALFFWAGFFAKEIIILLLPVMTVLWISDIRKGRDLRFWKYFIPAMFFISVGIAGIYYLVTGDINFIYNSIQRNHNEVFVIFTADELLRRLTYEPVIFLFSGFGYSVLILFTILFAFNRQARREPLIANAFLLMLLLLALYWWLPTSFTTLSPILLFGYERMWMMLLVPLTLIAAVAIHNMVKDETNKSILLMISLFLIAAIVAAITISFERSVAYFLFVMSGVVLFYLKKKKKSGNILVFIPALPMVIIAVYFVMQNSNW